MCGTLPCKLTLGTTVNVKILPAVPSVEKNAEAKFGKIMCTNENGKV